tara:strand:- start:2728 stop:3000 length:273 start_codon:yes stop_codon:yes gene_type:complete
MRKIIVKAIWDTEEKAIIFFRSVVYKQVAPTRARLSKDTMIKILRVVYEVIVEFNRRIPMPPNLSKMPAKIIDPYTGASTWAKGSQRWSP